MRLPKPENARALIFDGDDTLWDTMPIYTQAKQKFYSIMSRCGFGHSEPAAFFEKRDSLNVAKLGFSRRRMQFSMLETYRHFCQQHHIKPIGAVETEIKAAAQAVFIEPAQRMPYAEQVLRTLRKDCKLLLLTKGERSVQRWRLKTSRLAGYFDAVLIVGNKNAEIFARVVQKFRLNPQQTFSIGNSIRSDINPAIAAGLRAIWVPSPTWQYEVEAPVNEQDVIRVKSLRQVPSAVRLHFGKAQI